MQQTLIIKYPPAKTIGPVRNDVPEIITGVVVEHGDDDFDIMAAIKAASAEFIATSEGIALLEKSSGRFDYGMFLEEIPDALCEKHGFALVDTFTTDLIVNHDDSLLPGETNDRAQAECFVIYDPDLKMYYVREFCNWTKELKYARIFSSKELAAHTIIEENIRQACSIVPVSIKAES